MSDLPGLLIVGVAKSGTTSIYDALTSHPQVYYSPVKEPNFHYYTNTAEPTFYVKGDNQKLFVPNNYSINLGDYLDLYDGAESYLTIDASPVYFFKYQKCIESIHQTYANIKQPRILIVLRDPAQRAWSHYLHHIRDGGETRDFKEIVQEFKSNSFDQKIWPGWDYINQSFYSASVAEFLRSFTHVKVVLFDELNNDYQGTMSDVCNFLGLEEYEFATVQSNISGIPPENLLGTMWKTLISSEAIKRTLLSPYSPLKKQNLKKIRDVLGKVVLRKPSMNEDMRKLLVNIYQDDIKKLEKIINKDLSVWYEY